MNQFTIVGHLTEEPIENLETAEVELKVNVCVRKSNISADVVIKATGTLALNTIQYGYVDQLIGVVGHFEDNAQLVADKITFLNTKIREEK